MRTLLLLILLLISSGCAQRVTSTSPSNQSKQPDVTSSSTPDGWIAFRKPTEADLRCANYSAREWRVSLDGDRLQIRLDTRSDHQDPLPPEIRSKNVAAGSKGARHVIRVTDGWLVGMDVGEFGGGLWWFSSDGRRNKKLSDENVVGFANTSKGVLILVGLSHLGLDNGKVLVISDGTDGNRKLETLADLGSAPETFAIESPAALIVLTTTGLVRVRTTGERERLLRTEYQLLYPTSMTLSSSGVIHIGMRHFVTRLTPSGNTYREEWFSRSDCPEFSIRDLDCVCGR